MYYVYVAYLDGVEKYVGYGKGNRYKHVNSGTSHVRVLNEIVLKDERLFDVVIWEDKLTRSEAIKLENQLIKQFGRKDLNEGSLLNTSSGHGFLQGQHTKEVREKISKASKKRWNSLSKEEYDEYVDKLKNSDNEGRFEKGYTPYNKNKKGVYGKVWKLENKVTGEHYTFESKHNLSQLNQSLAKKLNIEVMKKDHHYKCGRYKDWYLTIIREERK